MHINSDRGAKLRGMNRLNLSSALSANMYILSSFLPPSSPMLELGRLPRTPCWTDTTHCRCKDIRIYPWVIGPGDVENRPSACFERLRKNIADIFSLNDLEDFYLLKKSTSWIDLVWTRVPNWVGPPLVCEWFRLPALSHVAFVG